MGQYVKINVPTSEGGLIDDGTTLAAAGAGGGTTVNGTASTVAYSSGDITLTPPAGGDIGTGWDSASISVTITGGNISLAVNANISDVIPGAGIAISIAVPAVFTGGSEWDAPITGTISSADLFYEPGIHLINTSKFIGVSDGGINGDPADDENFCRVYVGEPGSLANYKVALENVATSLDRFHFMSDLNAACVASMQNPGEIINLSDHYTQDTVRPVAVDYRGNS